MLESAKSGYGKGTGGADPIPWWGHAVRGSPETLPGLFSPLASWRVTIWRASLQREESMQTRRKGLISLLVAVETGSIPLWRQCDTQGKALRDITKTINSFQLLPQPGSGAAVFLPASSLLFPSWFSLALLFSSSPTSVLSGTLFSPFLFSSHLFPVPFSPHFTPLPCVNSPWWSSSQTQLQTDFRMLFLSAETWRAGQCSQYSSALAILLPGSVFHDTQICSYKKTLLCFCFIPVVSVGASFHKFLWHPVSLRQTCSKEFWFSVAPKIPFLCFNKGTGHIWSFCYISVQRGIWFISETCCTEFISLLHDSKRSVNILRTQEVPDKHFLVSCFCKSEYWLI